MAQPISLEPASIPAVILAGGMGTRLRSVMVDRPKVLAPVNGRPFLAYLLDQLEAAGWRQVILCTGYMADQIQQTFGTAYKSLSLAYSVETEPLGTAGAVRLALSHTSADVCLVMNGDSYVNADLRAFRDWHIARALAGSLLLTRVQDAGRFGTVEVGADSRIQGFHEKQGLPLPGWINAGIYLLPRRLLESIPPGQAVSIERECFPRWTQDGLGAYCVETDFIDIGTPDSFARAETFFAHLAHLNGNRMDKVKSLLPQNAPQTIRQHFEGSIATKQRVIKQCIPDILAAAEIIATSLSHKGRLFLCGNGGSAADCQHIAAEFVSVLTQDFLRPGLPAVALTTDTSIMTASANDFGFAGVFARQVQALGQPGDVVVGISTSGNSENVVRAMQYARENGLRAIALTGASGGKMAAVADAAVRIPSPVVQHIQEAHIAVGHILCHLVERALFPELAAQTASPAEALDLEQDGY